MQLKLTNKHLANMETDRGEKKILQITQKYIHNIFNNLNTSTTPKSNMTSQRWKAGKVEMRNTGFFHY